MLRKVHVLDRNYNEYIWFDGYTLVQKECHFNPLDLKLFTEDIIEVNEEDKNSWKLIHSGVRQMKYIPGILVTSGKTYGRYKKKLLYKCLPDDRRFPAVLIPYEDTKGSFSKKPVNLYVTFVIEEWIDKHPIGKLTNNLGSVEKLENFYEYQLYCKSLYASIQDFTKDTMTSIKQKTEEDFITSIMQKYPSIIDRTETDLVFSIDPHKSQDFDDAYSIKILDETNLVLSIYISNVAIWMEALDLWNSFSERIATIYLPDRKRPMLPNILSDCLCSLLENSKRFTYCLDVYITENKITNMEMKNCLIKPYKNYRYEEESLLNDDNYKLLFNTTSLLCREKRLIQSIKDSHDVVAYLMILMNCKCAEIMIENKNGIYRSVTLIDRTPEMPTTMPEDVKKFLKIWNCTTGQYSIYSEQLGHMLVSDGVDSYVHISSPIRRLVDLLNSITLHINLNLIQFGESAITFYNKWLDKLEYINTTMRAIRRVQTECSLLEMITKHPNLEETIFDGYVFDKIKRNDGLFQYIVYLHPIKIITRITARQELNNYESGKFKVYLFQDENTLKRKIRLQLLD